jgi:hypothetical protein
VFFFKWNNACCSGEVFGSGGNGNDDEGGADDDVNDDREFRLQVELGNRRLFILCLLISLLSMRP